MEESLEKLAESTISYSNVVEKVIEKLMLMIQLATENTKIYTAHIGIVYMEV